MRVSWSLCFLLLVGTTNLATATEEQSSSESNENPGYVLALPVNDDENEPIAEESQTALVTQIPPDKTTSQVPEEKTESQTEESGEPVVVLIKENDNNEKGDNKDEEEEKGKSNSDATGKPGFEIVKTEVFTTSQNAPKQQNGFRRPKFDEIAKILGLPSPMSPLKSKPIPPEKPKLFSPFSKALPRLPTPFGNLPFPLPLRREGSRLFNLPDLLHVATSLIKRALVEETIQGISKGDKDDDDDDDDDDDEDDGPMVLPIPVPTIRKPSMMLRSLPLPPPSSRSAPIPIPHPISFMHSIQHTRPIAPVPSYLPIPTQHIPRIIHTMPQVIPHPQPLPPPPPHMMPFRPVPHHLVPFHSIPHPVMHQPPIHPPRPMHIPMRPPPPPPPPPMPFHPRIQPMFKPHASSLHPVLILFTPVPVPVPVPVHRPRQLRMSASSMVPREEVILVQQPVSIQHREGIEARPTEQEEVMFVYPEQTQPRPMFVPHIPKPMYMKPREGPSPKLKLLKEIIMAKHALNRGVPYGSQSAASTPLVRQIKMMQIIQHQLRFLPFLRPRA